MFASQKVQVLSNLRCPETQLRHARGTNEQVLQQAPETTLKTQFFQFTVYEVEYQKTVNTKLWKRIICFIEEIKKFYHQFQQKRLEDTKT